MLRNLKNLGAVLIILFLLPYLAVSFSVRQELAQKVDFRMSPLEIYVCQAAAAVLPDICEDEFIKAQIILIRTNTVKKLQMMGLEKSETLERSEELGESFLDTELLETRFGNRLYRLAQETEGQILVYEGEPIEAAYHAVSNGNTRKGEEVPGAELPYLVMAECPEDILSPDYLCRTEYPVEEWEDRLGSSGEKWPKVEILERDSAGYVSRVKINEELLTGEQFREKLGLCSADFTIEEIDGVTIITTKGRGHGLGLSQYTAEHMAKEGKDHEEILAVFFPGTELIKTE